MGIDNHATNEAQNRSEGVNNFGKNPKSTRTFIGITVISLTATLIAVTIICLILFSRPTSRINLDAPDGWVVTEVINNDGPRKYNDSYINNYASRHVRMVSGNVVVNVLESNKNEPLKMKVLRNKGYADCQKEEVISSMRELRTGENVKYKVTEFIFYNLSTKARKPFVVFSQNSLNVKAGSLVCELDNELNKQTIVGLVDFILIESEFTNPVDYAFADSRYHEALIMLIDSLE
jgi:hypothetical protein